MHHEHDHKYEAVHLLKDEDIEKTANGSHSHSHSHSHGSNFTSRLRSKFLNKENSFRIVGVITFVYAIAELVVAIIPPSSLTLLSDGFHNLSDVISLLIAYYASKAAGRDTTEEMTYGYGRVEVLGGLTNAIFLISLCLYIFLEAIPRLIQPEAVDDGLAFIVVAVLGLVVNTFGTVVFGRQGHAHSHGHSHGGHSHGHGGKKDVNVMAVFTHYLGDMFSSLFVLIAGIIIHVAKGHKWAYYIDPISSLIIIILILYFTVPLVKDCFYVLIQKAPPALDVKNLKSEILSVAGVLGMHDFHVWQFVDGLDISSTHLVCLRGSDESSIISKVKQILHSHNLHSTTIQLEWVDAIKKEQELFCTQNCVPKCHEDWCCRKVKKRHKKKKKYNTMH